jgi:hypothetical protein
MRHIDDATAIAAAEDRADQGTQEHLLGCERCRRLVDSYARLLAAMTSAAAQEPLPQGMTRWARSYARTRIETRPRWTFLPFLSHGAPLAAAVRGSELPGVALLFGDTRHHVDIRVESSPDGEMRLHGQIVPLIETAASPWRVTAVAPSGEARHTFTDLGGEFWFDAVEGWQATSLVAENEGERLVVARLGDGAQGGGPWA